MAEYQHWKEAIMAAINDLAREHEEVCFLDADLSSCIGSGSFKKEFPERFKNCGIAEQNMAAVAGGLSAIGMVPFMHTFGCFASRRMYDQLFLSCGYAKRRAYVIGSDPGITAQANGGTHMPFEDIALMRQIPDMYIIEPSDHESLYQLTKQLYDTARLGYIRTPRKGGSSRYNEDSRIILGESIELKSGKDVAIIATGGIMVDEAIKAYEILKARNIDATIIDMHTIKPLDKETISRCVSRTGKLIVCENGRYQGGIGEAIAREVLLQGKPCKMDFLAVDDRYGEVGKLPYLQQTFGMTAENIVAKAEVLVSDN